MPILGIIASSKPGTATYSFLSADTLGLVYGSTNGTTWNFLSNNYYSNANVAGGYAIGPMWYANSKYYAAATGYLTIFTSTNGTTWTNLESNIYYVSGEATYANSVYLATFGSSIGVSTDGITYAIRDIPYNGNTFPNVAYGNSTYVACAGDTAVTSTDNITWTSRATGLSANMAVQKFRYLNNLFIAVGIDNSNAKGMLGTSTDGITWSQRTVSASTGSDITDIAYGNGKYVASTSNIGAQYSTDGTTWTTPTFAGANAFDYFRYVIYGGGKFVIGGNTTYVNSSTDGVTWTRAASGYTEQYGCMYDGSTYYFGLYTDSTTNPTADIVVSTNLTTWTTRALLGLQPNTLANTSIAKGFRYLNNNYLMGGYGPTGYNALVYVSTDLTTWTTRNTNIGSQGINDFAYGNNVYICAGSNGSVSSSTDTVTWTSRTSGLTAQIICAGYGNGKFAVAGGLGQLSTSTDGTTWTSQTSGFASTILACKYLGSQWIFAGASGSVSTSTDAITWTSRTSAISNTVRDIAYGNGVYVLVASAGEIQTSTDGITWTSRSSNLSGSSIYGVAYKNNLFVAVSGNNYTTNRTGANGYISSTDGITWSTRIVNTAMLSATYTQTILAL